MFAPFSRASTTVRLVAAFALIIAVLGLASAWSYRRARDERSGVALEETAHLTETASTVVYGLLRDLDGTTLTLSTALGADAARGTLDQATIAPYLAPLGTHYPFVRAFYVMNAQGITVGTPSGQNLGFDLSSQSYVRDVQSGRDVVLSDLLPGPQTGTPLVVLARAIRPSPGAPLAGILAVAFYPDRLTEVLPSGLPGDAVLSVFDRSGRLVFSTARPRLPFDQRAVGTVPEVGDALAGRITTRANFTPSVDGEGRLGATVPVAEYGWAVAVTRERSAVLAPVERFYRRELASLGLAAAIAMGLAVLVSRALARPLAQLAAQAREFAREGGSGRGRTWGAHRSAASSPEVRSVAFALDEMEREIEARFDEQRATATALRQSEERLRAMIDQSPFSIQVIEPDGSTTRVNRAWEELWGITLAHLAGYSMRDDARLRQRGILPHIERAFAGEMSVIPAAVYDVPRTRDGVEVVESRWVSATIYPVCTVDNVVTEAVLVHEDLTAQRRAEEDLRRSEIRYQDIFENALEGMYQTGFDGRFKAVNPATARILGYDSPEQLIAEVPDTSVLWSDPEELRAYRSEMQASGRVMNFEGRARRRDGSERWLLMNGVARRDASGRIDHVDGMITDITERKQAESERERLLERERAARAEAEAAGRAKDEFLAVLSHELRTPLTPILGYTNLLRRRAQRDGSIPPDFLVESLTVIERAVRTETLLVEDLLDVSRIIAGKMQIDREQLDLREVVSAAVSTVQPAADAKEIAIQVTAPPQRMAISGDDRRLQQAVWNLLTNAVKFTPEGGRVDVQIEERRGEAVLTVVDTGPGIPATLLPHVFERFQQGDGSSTRAHGGLGLGLGIAKAIVHMHGGRIDAHSEGEGRGATFTIALPLAQLGSPAGGAAALPAGAGADGASDQPLGGLLVLLVEDEENTRAMATTALGDAGARVRAAASCGEALSLVRDLAPDVILTDIAMPGKDGYALLRGLREAGGRAADVPVVAMTAFAGGAERERAHVAGFSAFITKPVTVETLVNAVASAAAGAVRP